MNESVKAFADFLDRSCARWHRDFRYRDRLNSERPGWSAVPRRPRHLGGRSTVGRVA